MPPVISTDDVIATDLEISDTPAGAMSKPMVTQAAKIIRKLKDRFMAQRSHGKALLRSGHLSRLRDVSGLD